MYETLFALYLLSGVIKQLGLLFQIVPPDITLILLVGILSYNIGHFSKHINRIKIEKILKQIILLFFIIFFLLLFSSLYSESENGKYFKIVLYLIVAYSFFIPFNKPEFNIKLFLRIFLFFSLVIGLLYVYFFPKIYLHDYKSLENNIASLYLTVGYLCGLIVLLLLRFSKLFVSKLNILFIFIFIFILLVSGARGPLLFMAISMIVFITVSKIKITRVHFIYAFVLLGILLSFNISIGADYLSMLDRSNQRFSLLFAEDAGNSVNTRLNYISFSLDKISSEVSNFFFGMGVNSYGILSTGKDIFSHPHNIFLEIFFEIGLLGLIFFIALFCLFFYYIFKHERELLPVFIYLVLNAMKSSSYVQSRILFGMIGILFFIIIQKQKNIIKDEI